MIPVVTAEEMRRLEAPLLAAGEDLMGRAAAAVADGVRRLAPSGPVLVACGPGNNGGDGLFAAATLAAEREVTVWLTADDGHEAGLAAARAAGVREVDAAEAVTELESTAVVVDAVLGIGGRPGLPSLVADFADACEALGVPVLAVDLPSGLDADSAEAHPCLRATATVTFAAAKACHVLAPAAERCGRLGVAPLGTEAPAGELRQLEVADVARWWPVPDSSSDKYSRGVVGLVTGSGHYPGAAVLGCAGALHTGTGMVRYLGEAGPELVLGRFPSVVTADGRVQALVLGSGWGDDVDGAAALAAARERDVPLVLDADALRLLPADLPANSLITPHAGELAALLSVPRESVTADPVGSARRAAERFGAAVLLKGGNQVVATPEGTATLAVRGPAWPAQAGSGDVLAGACGALLAAGLDAWRAAALAASLQACAAERHPGPCPPDALAERFPETLAALLSAAGPQPANSPSAT